MPVRKKPKTGPEGLLSGRPPRSSSFKPSEAGKLPPLLGRSSAALGGGTSGWDKNLSTVPPTTASLSENKEEAEIHRRTSR